MVLYRVRNVAPVHSVILQVQHHVICVLLTAISLCSEQRHVITFLSTFIFIIFNFIKGMQCPYSRTTLMHGQQQCNAFSLKVQTNGFYIIGSVFVFIYLGCITLTGLNSPPLIAFSFFPALDVISDILYLVNTSFYNVELFSTCFLFLLAPTLLFVKTLIDYNAIIPSFIIKVPSFMTDNTLIWLSVTRTGSPLYHGNKLWLSLEEHETLLKILYFLILWICCILAQIFCIVLLCLFYLPFFA
jgi:hypothetical protein